MGSFGTAWQAFWQILRDPEKAEAWRELAAPAPEQLAEPAPAEPPEDVHPDAVYALALLQREGRLVDFLLENIEPYDDSQIGAAVRQIHAGCRRVLDEHFDVTPIQGDGEGSRVEVAKGFDPSAIRLTGNVSGDPPFQGTVQHRGWRAAKVDLPKRNPGLDTSVICPAEVEI